MSTKIMPYTALQTDQLRTNKPLSTHKQPTFAALMTHNKDAGTESMDAVRARISMTRTQALATLAQVLESNGDNAAGGLSSVLSAQSLLALSGTIQKAPSGLVSSHAGTHSHKQSSTQNSELGELAARFESGKDGVGAIGYDRNGGTSYGTYQISSRQGTMKGFLDFLHDKAPDLATRLEKSGPANTGNRTGAMPDEWKKIAGEAPERFNSLQKDFITQSHYEPAMNALSQKIDVKGLSPTAREVLWSTAVQHGPAGATRIFSQAAELLDKAKNTPKTSKKYEEELISQVYDIRGGQFGSSSAAVQNSVKNRFNEEKLLALNMLKGSSFA